MVQRLFGSESQQLQRLQVLRANKFVDSNVSSAWCPKPGCGRAVSLTGSWHGEDRGTVPPTPATVTCTCKTKFCFACKVMGGHEPVPCAAWKEWITDLGSNHALLNENASAQWLQGNSRACSCGAQIQRISGCNHMICTVCGHHFCYACGQDWQLHRSQPGGLDHYVCKLSAPSDNETTSTSISAAASKAKRFQAALPGWVSNTRDLGRQSLARDLLLHIAETFELDRTYEPAVHDAFDRFMEARAIVQRCYVLKFQWTISEWRRRLDSLVGELEGATTALENVLGFVQVDLAMRASTSFNSCTVAPTRAEEVAKLLDLRQLAPRVIAASEMSSAISQLSTAVKLQTSRILDACRMGFPEKRNNGLLWAAGIAARGTRTVTQSRQVQPSEQESLISRCSLM